MRTDNHEALHTVPGTKASGDEPQCFEQACQDAPFNMHASRTVNDSNASIIMTCFEFVAIGCYAAPKGCCPEVARRFTGLEFDISESSFRPRAALMLQVGWLCRVLLHSVRGCGSAVSQNSSTTNNRTSGQMLQELVGGHRSRGTTLPCVHCSLCIACNRLLLTRRCWVWRGCSECSDH